MKDLDDGFLVVKLQMAPDVICGLKCNVCQLLQFHRSQILLDTVNVEVSLLRKQTLYKVRKSNFVAPWELIDSRLNQHGTAAGCRAIDHKHYPDGEVYSSFLIISNWTVSENLLH
jgi:hypothetical protein